MLQPERRTHKHPHHHHHHHHHYATLSRLHPAIFTHSGHNTNTRINITTTSNSISTTSATTSSPLPATCCTGAWKWPNVLRIHAWWSFCVDCATRFQRVLWPSKPLRVAAPGPWRPVTSGGCGVMTTMTPTLRPCGCHVKTWRTRTSGGTGAPSTLWGQAFRRIKPGVKWWRGEH